MAKTQDVAQAARSAVEQALAYPPPAAEAEVIGKVPRKTNGPATSRDTVERGLAHFDSVTAERDELDRQLKAARERIHLLELQIEQLEGTRNTIESRINQCVLERDNAVREAGELRGALNAVAAICVRYHDAQQD